MNLIMLGNILKYNLYCFLILFFFLNQNFLDLKFI